MLNNSSSLTNIPYVLSQACGQQAGAPGGHCQVTATLCHVAAPLVACHPAATLQCPHVIRHVFPFSVLSWEVLLGDFKEKNRGFQLPFLPLFPSRQDLVPLLLITRLGREVSAGSKE